MLNSFSDYYPENCIAIAKEIIFAQNCIVQADVQDVAVVFKNSENILTVVGHARGENRILKAFEDALEQSKYIVEANYYDLLMAEKVLVQITYCSSHPVNMNEMEDVNTVIREKFSNNSYYVWAMNYEEKEDDLLTIRLIAGNLKHKKVEKGKSYMIPKFPVPEGMSAINYLRQQADAGLKQLIGDFPDTIRPYVYRLKKELEAIERWDVADYFLVVADYVNYLRQNYIVGPGRGSCASSLVNYCLGITQVDPLEYDLMFSRFMKMEQQSMPDIDIDTDHEGETNIMGYLIEKYGFNHVARIRNSVCGIVRVC